MKIEISQICRFFELTGNLNCPFHVVLPLQWNDPSPQEYWAVQRLGSRFTRKNVALKTVKKTKNKRKTCGKLR